MVAKEAEVDEREVLSMAADIDNWLSTITDTRRCESAPKLVFARIHRFDLARRGCGYRRVPCLSRT